MTVAGDLQNGVASLLLTFITGSFVIGHAPILHSAGARCGTAWAKSQCEKAGASAPRAPEFFGVGLLGARESAGVDDGHRHQDRRHGGWRIETGDKFSRFSAASRPQRFSIGPPIRARHLPNSASKARMTNCLYSIPDPPRIHRNAVGHRVQDNSNQKLAAIGESGFAQNAVTISSIGLHDLAANVEICRRGAQSRQRCANELLGCL